MQEKRPFTLLRIVLGLGVLFHQPSVSAKTVVYAEASTGIKAEGRTLFLRGDHTLAGPISARIEAQSDRFGDRDFSILAPGVALNHSLGTGLRWLSDISILVSLGSDAAQQTTADRVRLRTGLAGGVDAQWGQNGVSQFYGELFALRLGSQSGFQGMGLVRAGLRWQIEAKTSVDAPLLELRIERGSERALSGDKLRLFGIGLRANHGDLQLSVLHSWSDREALSEVISERRVWALLVYSAAWLGADP